MAKKDDDNSIDLKDYLFKYGKVRAYSIEQPIMPISTWGSLSVHYEASHVAMMNIEVSLPVIMNGNTDVSNAVRKWAEEGRTSRISSLSYDDKAPIAKSAALKAAEFKAAQKAAIELEEKNKELEQKVKDLESRLTNLIGVLR